MPLPVQFYSQSKLAKINCDYRFFRNGSESSTNVTAAPKRILKKALASHDALQAFKIFGLANAVMIIPIKNSLIRMFKRMIFLSFICQFLMIRQIK